MSRREGRRPGDLLVAVGVVLFLLGVAAVLLDVLPFFAGTDNRPLWLNLASFLAPLGFGLALLGLLRSVLAATRRGRALELALEREELADRAGPQDDGTAGPSRS